MKRQIRMGLFETNSSSVHAICISRKDEEFKIPNNVTIRPGEFGWEFREYYDWNNKLSYIYQICKSVDHSYEYARRHGEESDAKHYGLEDGQVDRFINILKQSGIDVCVEDSDYTDGWPKDLYDCNGYVDHESFLWRSLNEILSDKNRLLKFLFGYDSYVATGNDNSYDDIVVGDKGYDTYWKYN